jgi:hypothetical protein
MCSHEDLNANFMPSTNGIAWKEKSSDSVPADLSDASIIYELSISNNDAHHNNKRK